MRGGEVMIVLDKINRAFWPRLTREKKRHPFVSVDFERWREESSSSSEGEKEGNFPFFAAFVAESLGGFFSSRYNSSLGRWTPLSQWSGR